MSAPHRPWRAYGPASRPARLLESVGLMQRVGFAVMDPEKRRKVASRGGKAAHAAGHAHEFTPEEARLAGRLGGELVSQDREYMAEIGRRGGRARRKSQSSV